MYDKIHDKMFAKLMDTLHSTLRVNGISKDKIGNLAEELAFNIFSILDGTDATAVDEKHYVPKISFIEESEDSKEIAGDTYFHELVMGYFDDFEDGDDSEEVQPENVGAIVATRAYGGAEVLDINLQIDIVEDIQKAIEPVALKYKLEPADTIVFPLEWADDAKCSVCGKYDIFDSDD